MLNHFHPDPEAFLSERAASGAGAALAAPSSPAAEMDVPDAVPSNWIDDMLIQTFHFFFKERKKIDHTS